MKSFKAQVKRDLKTVFHNTKEFAERTEIHYNGKTYNIPVILDNVGTKDRTKKYTDHEDSIYVCDAVMFVPYSSLKAMPRKNTQIEVDGDLYKIVGVGKEMGEIVLELEMFDE